MIFNPIVFFSDMNTEIEKLRAQIDSIDSEIANLLLQRINLTSLVLEKKQEAHFDLIDKKREALILKTYLRQLNEQTSPEKIQRLVDCILQINPKYTSNVDQLSPTS